MRNRSLAGTLAAAIAMALTVPALVAAQTTPGAKTAGSAQTATKTAEKKPWKLSYTSDGQPDLQGIWTNLSFTPMVRPAKYGNREFLTKEEMDWDFKAGVARSYDTTLGNAADSPFYDATTYALDAWQNGIQPNPRTSLLVDPPNGQFPPLTPEAAKKRAARPAPNPQPNAITEYFTRTDETTIEYKFTVDDQTTWTAPWSAIVPLSRIKGPMPEFACTEGNFALVEILASARAADKAATGKATVTPNSQK